MGAAFDLMCENEGLETTLSNRNRKIREQKKLITELAEGIVKYFDGDNNYPIKESNEFFERAKNILAKQNKKKKK
jgi:hypothetical protein